MNNTLDIRHTSVFTKNLDAYQTGKYRFLLNEGGARSSKTISIAQFLIYLSMVGFKDFIITIVRKTFPSLRASAMRDFIDQLRNLQIYSEANHDKSNHTYRLNNNEIEFISLDEPQKVRGRKRHVLWINEANELTYEDFKQLNMRTSHLVIFDYNPSDEYHWLYDKIDTRKDCIRIPSTYKDNPFLEQSIINEIEAYKEEDLNYWTIYGLGERGKSMVKIYSNIDTYKELPSKIEETIYGMDFGFTHYFVLLEINICENDCYLKHKIFNTRLLNSDCIKQAEDLGIDKNAEIYADSARPDLIQEWRDSGYNVHEAEKSVEDGIDYVRRKKIHIHEDDVEPLKQWRNYQYKTDSNGEILSDKQPVKKNDDCPDAGRYGIYTHFKNPILEPNFRTL